MIAQCLNGPVQAGDMVRIVMPTQCCGDRRMIGEEYRVLLVGEVFYKCLWCGRRSSGIACFATPEGANFPNILLRIDPPEVADALLRETESTA